MAIEIDELVNAFSGLLECLDFLAVDALGLEDGEEISRLVFPASRIPMISSSNISTFV